MEWLLFLAVGLVLGAGLAWAFAGQRTRTAVEAARRDGAERLAAAETTAQGERQRREDVERERAGLQQRQAGLQADLSAALTRVEQAQVTIQEQKEFVERSRKDLENAFQSLAGQALRASREDFLQLAGERLAKTQLEAGKDLEARQKAIETMLSPLTATLTKLETRTGDIEKAREGAYAKIDEQVRGLFQATESLQRETVVLATALKGSAQARGKWAEVQLRNIAELCGMLEHCDFEEQKGTEEGLRPDMTIRLPGGRRIAVDSKAPMTAYLEAQAAATEDVRREAQKRHARAVKEHAQQLAEKEYAPALGAGTDLVVMFLPGEPYLAAAYATDPDLHQRAWRERVLIATPTTFVALLRTLAIYHQQEALAANAAKIAETAHELYERAAKFAEDLARVGKGLKSAVAAYNDAVGAFERNVVPMGRRLEEMKVAEQSRRKLAPPAAVEEATRTVRGPGADA